MFIDDVHIIVEGGRGGNGKVHFRRDATTAKGGPDGGNGGNGGSVYIQGSHNLNDLRQFRFKKKVSAENGIDGKGKNLFGKNAKDLTIYLPIGTIITDKNTGETLEITDSMRRIVLARGGTGGRGNTDFATATNRTPRYAEKGTPGERRELHLELKRIADIGLIGLPNAGKSSLLSVLTNAEPKIGNYPFTTLEPNIGMMEGYSLADIPGLIEGASEGKGLGTKFLKHIEKTKMLVHCIDASVSDPLASYEIVRKELGLFSPLLLEKPEIIAILKTDLISEEELRKRKELFTKRKCKVLTCTLYQDTSVQSCKQSLLTLLEENSQIV